MFVLVKLYHFREGETREIDLEVQTASNGHPCPPTKETAAARKRKAVAHPSATHPPTLAGAGSQPPMVDLSAEADDDDNYSYENTREWLPSSNVLTFVDSEEEDAAGFSDGSGDEGEDEEDDDNDVCDDPYADPSGEEARLLALDASRPVHHLYEDMAGLMAEARSISS